jgi:hypothetical protein
VLMRWFVVLAFRAWLMHLVKGDESCLSYVSALTAVGEKVRPRSQKNRS